MKELPKTFKVISQFTTGSQLYGTNTPLSDTDVRGVFIPTKEYYYGFLDHIRSVKLEDEEDTEFFEIRNFLDLALDNNPNVLEFLFVPQNKLVITSEEWNKILEYRKYFISKKVKHTFLGYAISQVKRVKLHRRWLLNPPKKKPERKDFGLPENRSLLTQDQIGAFNRIVSLYLEQIGHEHELRQQLMQMEESHKYAHMVGQLVDTDYNAIRDIVPVSENFLEALEKEKRYARALQEWKQYQNWKENRNQERSELERKYGYDTKHLQHCLRLLSEGEEILLTGNITFPRPDKEYLLDVKNGKYKYDELISKLEHIEEYFQNLYNKSTLPKEPNRRKINELCINIVEEFLRT